MIRESSGGGFGGEVLGALEESGWGMDGGFGDFCWRNV